MKNLVLIAMVMGLIGLSFEAVCQEVHDPYGGEPFGQTGEGMGGGFGAGYAPGPGGTGMPGMPGMPMAVPSFEMQKKTALIIPEKPMDTEAMGQITEDMHVMSQILYEKIHPEEVQPNKYLRWVGGFFGDGRDNEVAGLYLQGYGMVFLQQVDFPLMPVGEQPAATEPSGGQTDEVWQRMQKKLQGQYEDAEEAKAPRYDAAQVDKLKETVLLSLGHASNIRQLDGEEGVIVVIKSNPYRTGYAALGMVMMRPGGESMTVGPAKPMPEQPSFLVFRAKKKDIDDFAKGRIDPQKFAEKVSVIGY